MKTYVKAAIIGAGLSALLSLTSCFSPYVDGIVIKETGNVIASNCPNPTYNLQVYTNYGIYTMAVITNPNQKGGNQDLSALALAVREGDVVTFPRRSPGVFYSDRIGKVYINDIVDISLQKRQQSP